MDKTTGISHERAGFSVFWLPRAGLARIEPPDALWRRPMLWLWNLVDPAGARPVCQDLRGVADPLRSIAIVGNGPITAYQRQQIEAADVIIRFNKLDNWYCGDRMDIWVTRWANHVISKYHGIGEVEFCNTSLAAGAASAVWVLDAMEAKHARQLAEALAAYAPMRRLSLAKTVIDWPRMEALFHARLPDAEWNAVPSSGWAAMMLALECAPPRARIHLFGFNWSRRAWAAHKMGAEEAFARRLDAAGRIRIHWPACAGMRGCGGCPVVASYDERRGAVCVPRPSGPPGEGETLRATKFAKDNAWRAERDACCWKCVLSEDSD
ncbi:hypothetical protein WJX81_000464 [Elliptochloris bilobata]|uniref:Uncharacterized protein n=1 Tax=Elliptochloris bilobata TaxID=381761 RepID=A0AAW1SED5_9CHLO